MTGTHAKDWSNYWLNRTADQTGAALVGAGIEADSELEAFWSEVFSSVPADTRILDMACGAGSVLRAAAAAGLTQLTGIDISPEAIDALQRAIPGVRGVVTGAGKTPFEAAAFDLIVSQFGFEYAGWQAAIPEIIRLLAPGGQFTAIAHLRGGAIEDEVRARYDECVSIRQTGFIPAARDMFPALFRVDAAPQSQESRALYARQAARFRTAEQALSPLAAMYGGLARHLHQGTRTMVERRRFHACDDILGWLDGMAAEIAAYEGRMQSMLGAALADEDVTAMAGLLAEAGLSLQPPVPFSLQGEAAAWCLTTQPLAHV